MNKYGFSHARTALKYGLKSVGLKANDQILLPSYVCDVIVYPLQILGIKPIFYDVQNDLAPNWYDLESKLNNKTKALMMVHYFGFPQNISKFQDFCTANKLILIEDNAHGFGATYDGKLLGTFGEIGITSPRKTYDVFNGSYLYLKNENLKPLQLPGQPNIRLVRYLREGVLNVVTKLPYVKNLMLPYPDYSSQDGFAEKPIPDWIIDSESHKFIQNQDIPRDVKKRQKIHQIWLQWSIQNNLIPIFGARLDGCAPQVFPAYAESFKASKKWFHWGMLHGINVVSWPRLPRSVVAEDGSAMQIWRKLICFPITLDMDPEVLEEMLCNLSGPDK